MKNEKIYDILFSIPLFYFVFRMLFYTEEISRFEGAILIIPAVYIWFRESKKEKKNS